MEAPPFRHRSPVHLNNCHLAASFDFLGDRWSLLIVRCALLGIRRFDDFQSELDIPRNILSTRLKKLVEAGIMTRQSYKIAGCRPRPEYLLTEMGQALRLPFLAMRQWAERWVGNDRPPPMTIIRKSDDRPVYVSLVDSDGRPVAPDDLTATFADWAAEDRSKTCR